MHKRSLLLTTAMLALLLGGCDDGEPTPSNPGATSNPTSQTSNATTTNNVVGGSSSSDTQVNPSQTTSSSAQGSSSHTTSSYITSANTGSSHGSTTHITTGQVTSSHSGTHTGTGGGGPVTSGTSIAPTSSIAPISFTITFDSNGGSDVSSVQAAAGTQVNKPTDPTLSGYKFTGWSLNPDGSGKVTWPYTLGGDVTMYANWAVKFNFMPLVYNIIAVREADYFTSWLPDTMTLNKPNKYVQEEDVTYDFTNPVNVSDIKYGGYGEQWHTVIDTITQFRSVHKIAESLFPVVDLGIDALNLFLDTFTDNHAIYEIENDDYLMHFDLNGNDQYSDFILSYKHDVSLPIIGNVTPYFEINAGDDGFSLYLNLGETNYYEFSFDYSLDVPEMHYAYQLGIDSVKHYADVICYQFENYKEGFVVERTQLGDNPITQNNVYFKMDSKYISVVGKKASGLAGFDGYINELYERSSGNLLGYKVKETFTRWTVTKTYNTLWFNLSDIVNITSVKGISNGGVDPHENNHDIYLNGSDTIFTPKKNKILMVDTSRKYDVEFRKQYFYGYQDKKYVEYEVELPMMFIQDDGTGSGENNYSTFESDISSTNGISASVTLSNEHLTRIREDYLSLIDYYISYFES